MYKIVYVMVMVSFIQCNLLAFEYKGSSQPHRRSDLNGIQQDERAVNEDKIIQHLFNDSIVLNDAELAYFMQAYKNVVNYEEHQAEIAVYRLRKRLAGIDSMPSYEKKSFNKVEQAIDDFLHKAAFLEIEDELKNVMKKYKNF